MRSEGDGSQLHSLPRETRAIAPPGSSRPGTAAFQKTPPQERRRDLPSDASLRASCQLPCNAPAGQCCPSAEKGARGQEKIRGEQRLSIFSSAFPKKPEHKAAMRARTERFPPEE